MKFRESKLLNQLVTLIVSFAIPSIASYLAGLLWHGDFIVFGIIRVTYGIYNTFITLICGGLFLLTYYKLVPCLKFLRPFSKYEGRWLQIIPDKPKSPYAIIDFIYDHKDRQYEMYGANFGKDLRGNTNFQAYKFIEKSHSNGFYYITERTNENKNGLGKVSFIRGQCDNLIRAEGYFFDSSNDLCSRKYNTIMIKCNKPFFRLLGVEYSYLKLNKIPPNVVMEKCKKFADEQIEIYHNRNKINNACCKYKKTKHKISRRCK